MSSLSILPTLAPTGRAVLPAAARLLPLASRLASTGVLRRATTSAPRNISTTSGSSGRTTRAGAGALSTGAPPFGGGYRGGRRNFSSGSSSSSFGGSIPNISDIPAPSASLVAAAVVGASALYLAKRAVLMTDAGVTYVVQNNLTGQLDVHTEPGIHYIVPFFSTVTDYKQVITSTFEADEAVIARFADTYVGMIPVTFRFKLPADPEGVRKIHREFRSETNLVKSLLMRNASNVTVITATQYTGEEFFQGGLNQFKTQLADQLQNGIYLTERRQVEIEQTDLAPVGLASPDGPGPKLVRAKQLVWKTVPILQDNGVPQRAENPLSQYGIDVTQVLIGDPRPEPNLDRLLMDKKRLVAERIKTVQEQETSKAQANTEQLKKEIERTRAVQDAQRQKELRTIEMQREVVDDAGETRSTLRPFSPEVWRLRLRRSTSRSRWRSARRSSSASCRTSP